MAPTRNRRAAAPKGEQHLMTPEWKKAVQDELHRRGETRSWLAAQLGVSRSAVTKMLDPGRFTSSLVGRTSDLLGVAPPWEEIPTPEIAEAVQILKALDRDLQKAAVAQLRALALIHRE